MKGSKKRVTTAIDRAIYGAMAHVGSKGAKAVVNCLEMSRDMVGDCQMADDEVASLRVELHWSHYETMSKVQLSCFHISLPKNGDTQVASVEEMERLEEAQLRQE